MQWLLQLRRFRYDEGTTLGRRVTEMQSRLKNRSLVIVLSDLHDPKATDALKLLGQTHECVVLQLQDPAEVERRGTGFVRAQEAETGRAFVTHGRKQWLDQESVERELRRGGIDHLLLRTDRPFAHTLRHFFGSRALLGKGTR